jgi:hypothetical protein
LLTGVMNVSTRRAALVLAVAGAFALGGCGDSNEGKSASSGASTETVAEPASTEPATVSTTPDAPEPAPSDDGGGGDGDLSPADKRGFVKGCESSGQPRAGCECIYEELTERGIDTREEFEDLAADVRKGKISDDFRKAALACKDELQSG